MIKNQLPASHRELFENGNTMYKLIITDPMMDMNNAEATDYFLDKAEIREGNIEAVEGGSIFIKHPDFDFVIMLDCIYIEPFFSHAYNAVKVKKVNGEYSII